MTGLRLRLPIWVDRGLVSVLCRGPRIFFWPLLFAIALGATSWAATHFDRNAVMSNNGLDKSERLVALGFFAGAALLLLAIYGGAAHWRRRRTGLWPTSSRLARWHRLLAFTLAGPFVLELFKPQTESEHPVRTLVFIAAIVAACAPTLWELAALLPLPALPWPKDRAEPARPWRRYLAQAGRFAGPAAVAVLAVGYGLYFSYLSLNNHWGLRTNTIDLGLYDNIFYQSIHGNFLGCSFLRGGSHVSAHFDPVLVLLSPLYLIYPRAEMLLVLQSFWCAAGAVPAYLLGRHHTGSRWVGVVMAAVFVLYPAIHGANLYEFHSLTLLGMPLLFALYFLESGAIRRYYVMLPLLLAVREDVALLLCFVGIHAILTRRRPAVRAGLITIGAAAVYFFVVKIVVMTSPDFFNNGAESYGFAYYYREMIPNSLSLGDFLISLVTNPVFAVKVVLKEPKLIFAAKMLLPLLSLPLLARSGRVMMLYGAAFLLLATREPVFSTHFQYTTVLYPVLFALAPAGWRRLRDDWIPVRRLVPVLSVCLVLSSLLCSWKYGALWPNSSFRGGFKTLVRELTAQQRAEYAQLRTMVDSIPPAASVMVSNRLGAHVSNRAEVYFYRDWRDVDYVLIDERDLKSNQKDEHRERLESGTLELLRDHRRIKLYAVRAGTK